MNFDRESGKSDLKSNDFLQLEDGDTVKGVFAKDEMVKFKLHGYGKNGVLCTEDDTCSSCRNPDNYPAKKYRWNFIIKEGDTYVAKILEKGKQVHDTLMDLHDGGLDLRKTLVTISRKGKSKDDTRYIIKPFLNNNALVILSQEQLDKMSQVKLHTLAYSKPESTETNATSHFDTSEELPF